MKGQLGLEPTFQEYINKLCDIFDEVKRVLKKEGTCWVNIGDTYSTQSGAMRDGKFGPKNTNNQRLIQPRPTNTRNHGAAGIPKIKTYLSSKCLLQIPSRFAIEMTNRGWILRNEIIWHKPNCMPCSVKDRFTVDFEKIFFFTKSKKYYFETQHEPHKCNENYQHGTFGKKSLAGKKGVKIKLNPKGRNKRCVWTINTKPYKNAHFAAYPPELIETPIKAGCPKNGVVLDPFIGSGTTAEVARSLGRQYIGIDINEKYIEKYAKRRVAQQLLIN